jgi:hypothetical protein
MNFKKSDNFFFILKNIQLLIKKILNIIIKYSDIGRRVEQIETYLAEVANDKKLEWEKNYLNGQYYRRKIISELLNKINFDFIIETGTEYGFSTAYFSTFGKKVFSIEKSKILFSLAKKKLGDFTNIHLILNDSKNIKKILNQYEIDKKSKVFFYLDAHSENDYPILEELEFITSSYQKNLIIIDDFQVPSDDGYGFDSFNGRKLNIKLISKSLIGKNFIYFPKISSTIETGRLRGYVLITNNESIKKELDTINELYLF